MARYAEGDCRHAGVRPTTPRGPRMGYFWPSAHALNGSEALAPLRGTFCHNPQDTRPRAVRRAKAREWAKLERIAQRGEVRP